MGKVKEAVFAWPPVSNQTEPQVVLFNQGVSPASQSTNNAFLVAQASSMPSSAFTQQQSSTVTTTTTSHPSALQFVSPAHSFGSPNSTNNKVVQQPSSYPLVPLSGGGYIFNYPPLYTTSPIVPFSQPLSISIPQNMVPVSPPSSPISVPTSPVSNMMLAQDPNVTRKERLEKYRHKRSKRNWNRPADQARRERAQARIRDEFGHFVASSKSFDNEKEKSQEEMEVVRSQLEAWRRESQMLKDRLSQIEQRLEEQQKLNNELLHENRILWSTVPTNDVFNTLNPEASYVDAFKEKIDFTNVELNTTDSRYVAELLKVGDELDSNSSSRSWIDSNYIAGSLS